MNNDPRPPRLFHTFFRWFCQPTLRDGIEGDLLELYHKRIMAYGKSKADRLFIRDVLLLFRPAIIKKFKRPQIANQPVMFKANFKIGWRNIVRNKTYAAVNITGLSVGIAACLLIFRVVQFETSFDNFHKNPGQVYRVVAATKTPDGMQYKRANAFPVAAALKIDFPRLSQVARIWEQDGHQVTVMDNRKEATEKKFIENNLFFADPEVFDIFNFPLVEGDARTALGEPNQVLLTQATAKKYFGDWHNAAGKFIKYDNRRVCKVTGILKDMPANTDLPLELVFSFKTSGNDTLQDWVSQTGNLNTFVVLPANLSPLQFNNELARFVTKHTPPEYANQGYILQPLSDMHYNSAFGTFRGSVFSHELITTLTLIGIFLVIIACVNFINLATAQAVNRAKEVGVRKVLGSRKKQLIVQFLSETFIITVIAAAFAVFLAWLGLPFLNSLLRISVGLAFDWTSVVYFIAGIFTVTLLSGFYPAVILSGFSPVAVLKSKFSGKVGGLTLRRVLVVFQFTIAQVLIIGTLVVVRQMDFFRNTSMGFDKDEVVTAAVPNDSTSLSKFFGFKQELLRQPGIKSVSFSTFSPSDDSHWGSDFKFDNAIKTTAFSADLKWADADYFKLYDINFIAGKQYTDADSVTGFVVNRLLASTLGFKNPADIIGKKIDFWDGYIKANIVGVVEDFHGTTLAKQMKPIVMGSFKNTYQLVNIKLQSRDANPALAAFEKWWKLSFPDNVFGYQFLDDKIASFYLQEEQVSQLYKAFAAIAIFISCLGLYGLISFMAVQRTREVGIRKVLGASVGNIVYLFSKEFTLLVAIAFIIAAPVAWFFMNNWLQNFAYRAGIGIAVFGLTIVTAIVIAWIAVGYQAIKVALANPVKSLRTE
ncbi:MAG: FtsX-like permease family protein [Bacteroidota bacterium]